VTDYMLIYELVSATLQQVWKITF